MTTLTENDLREAASRLVTEWVFPGECYHTPDALTMVRADKLGAMLVERMRELVAQGTDPRGMTMRQVLPDVVPHEIPVTESDF